MTPPKPDAAPTPSPRGSSVRLRWLSLIPGIARMRALRPGTDAHIGAVIDSFAAFATIDNLLSPVEADLLLDMLRSAFPEVDHGWLERRLRRAIRSPRPLPSLALRLRENLNDEAKLAIALQLYTLVDASGRTDRSRAAFEVFMRRLGRPEYGSAILREMRNSESPPAESLPFECVTFGGPHGDVALPPAASDHAFRVYRAGGLMLVRNTGSAPITVRGRLLETGAFSRMRERQPLLVPGWSLDLEDLVFFLDAKRTGSAPAIYLEPGPSSIAVERTRTRNSEVRVRFGLAAEVEALKPTGIMLNGHTILDPANTLRLTHHDRIGDATGFSLSINELRHRALSSGRRFRLATEKREYLVSNDASALGRGDLLLGPKLSPRTVLFIRFDANMAGGELHIRENNGPILVDGIPVRNRAPLRDGSLIRLSGSQSVRCRFSEGFLDEERTLIESIQADDIIHDFGPGIRALDHIRFSASRGEMVCIIGPSGCGKSTLLGVLAGQIAPTRGHVRLNGSSLYEHRIRLVPFIAHMPQEEALNPQLTVREHLRHAVTIRRPALSIAEHERRVDSMLAELGLQSIARRRVGAPGEKTISGGERSRLNLGLDLGSRAEVFLFDEPISGLSSKDSEHVADTLRSLSREKIVIASLHRPGARMLRLFDKVLLLDNGGRTAFFGSPAQMIGYFRDACAEFNIPHPAVDSKAPLGADFVFDILETPLSAFGTANAASARRFPPSFWQERFERTAFLDSVDQDAGPLSQPGNYRKGDRLPLPPRPSRRGRAIIAVFATQFLRSFLSKIRNRGTIYSTFLEAPLLAFLIAHTLRSSPQGSYDFSTALHIPAYLFLSVTVAMFLGLTNSATEVLRDRPMLRRERNCQPGALSYVTAKFAALAIIAAAQCLIYLVVGNHFLEIDGMLGQHWLWMTFTALVGTALALFVSSMVRSERAALTAVPLLLVPQMLLAGALVPYREMNRGLFQNAGINRERGGSPVPSLVMPLRYCYEAMVVAQATRNPFEVERIRLQRRVDNFRNREILDDVEAERFELAKEGLRRLLASGAENRVEAASLASRIRRFTLGGRQVEVQTMRIWPEDQENARPTSEFFVNERIDLLVREAETFRNDYRNEGLRNVFLALRKPLPFSHREFDPANPREPIESGPFPKVDIETLRYCGGVLIMFITVCLLLTILAISRQNRRCR
ncbi:MAG: ATP-binding cassette domain-containing protein [Luteolibacter sp.]